MNEFFSQFPVIRYDNKAMINIMSRVVILNKLFNDQYAFYPYQVKNGMPAWEVAEKYYGDPDFIWLVYMSNNIIDPYYQWPMSDEVFNQSIIDTYGSVESASQDIVFYRVNWYDDNRILTLSEYMSLPANEKKYWDPDFDQFNNASLYRRKQIDYKVVNLEASGIMGDPIVGEGEAQYWSPVSALDKEMEDNANKANIRLLDNRLASTATDNLKQLLSQ